MVMPVAPGAPAAAPAPAGSSIARPTQSPGTSVAGIAKVRQAIKLLEEALRDVGSTSEIGDAILTSIKKLASKAPQNATTAGAESSQLQALAAKARQMAPMLALARSQGGGGAGGAGAPPGGGGAPTGGGM